MANVSDIINEINKKVSPNDSMVFPITASLIVKSGMYSYYEFADVVNRKLDEGEKFFDIIHEMERDINKELVGGRKQ